MNAKNLVLALATVSALGATLAASTAHAGNVQWAVDVVQPGLQSSMQVVVGNMPRLVHYSPPAVLPAPQVVYPAGAYYPAPVVVPVYTPAVRTAWAEPAWGYRHEWRERERWERMERERAEHARFERERFEHERFERERFAHGGWERR